MRGDISEAISLRGDLISLFLKKKKNTRRAGKLAPRHGEDLITTN